MSGSPARPVWIALGSNIGDRSKQLLEAVERLHRPPELEVSLCSHLYETAPVGYTDQPDFLNMALLAYTTLSPVALLSLLQEVEKAMGRERTVRYGPRTIDLDLLVYDDINVDLPELTVPHPRMLERAFVLIPLADVAEGLAFVRPALEKLDGKEDVALWKRTSWRREFGRFES